LSDREMLGRALDYPYRIPTGSYLQVDGRTLPLPSAGLGLEERTAVLALGSNAAPEVLDRKLASAPRGAPVPVVRARLRDFDSVYSAHVSAYGAVPATIQASPGTEVSTFVVYLTEDQLRLMSETEPNYELALLHGVSCQLDTGESLSSVASYLSRHGCLGMGGSEVALARVAARDRRFPAMTQPEVLEYVRSILAPDATVGEFIEQSASEEGVAAERTAALADTAKRFTGSDWERLDI
jgi:hypothetical protein